MTDALALRDLQRDERDLIARVPLTRKAIASIEWKAAADGVPDGSFSATFSTFNVVDKDLDVTLPNSMPEGKRINISSYGHSSWGGFSAALLPIGSGVVKQDDTHAWVEGRLWLDTPQGKAHYDTLKNQMADGVASEWSYGFTVLKSSTQPVDLAKWPGAVNVISQVDVFEASPVLRGAGEDTATSFVKSVSTLADRGDALVAVSSEFVAHARASVSMRKKEGRVLSQSNADRVSNVASGLEDAAGILRKMLDEATPVLADDGKAAAVLAARIADEAYEITLRRLRAA